MFYAASRSSILQIAVLAGEPHERLEIKFDSAQVSFTYKNIVYHSNMTVLHVNDVAGGKAMLRAGNIVCSVDAFVCPKAHFLHMQVSPKRRRGMPAGLEENEVIYASTVNTMLDLGCPQSLVMVN